jgi:thiamine biosynthesis lipoprotein
MDTTISLRATGTEAKQAVDEGFERIAQLDKLASSTNPDSDVSRINAAAGMAYVQVDPAIYEMIEYSQQYSEKSKGEWDITIGPITNLWGIGNADQHVPSDGEIKTALAKVEYRKILLRPEDHSVMLAESGMAIDLGGIAKGYAVDELRKIYAAHQIKKGLINMGASSMYAIGTNKEGKDWNIGIKHPRSDKEGDYLGIVSIRDQALSTSGDYERFFIADGVRYHHIFDPRTGRPAAAGVMSDTIVINSNVAHAGMLSDLLTTAVFVLGPDKGRDLINGMEGVECEITGSDGNVYVTEGFKKQFSNLNPDFHYGN